MINRWKYELTPAPTRAQLRAETASAAQDSMTSNQTSNSVVSPIKSKSASASQKPSPQQSLSNKPRVVFRYHYSNATLFQTEVRKDFSCPWCSLQCLDVDCLLCHLRACHDLFHFKLGVPTILVHLIRR